MSKATVGLFVPLEPKSDKGQAVADFLLAGKELIYAESNILQWYGIKFPNNHYGVFDTFAAESGRSAHLGGKVAETFLTKAGALVENGPVPKSIDIIASMIKPQSSSTEATVGIHVSLVAKPGKGDALKEFLISALPIVQEETETLQWFALRRSETEFGIFRTAARDSGRAENLGDKVSDARKAAVAELLASPQKIQKFEIVVSKVVV